MSLLGKVLALLNVFGALALVYFASVDYSKRQGWAYAAYRHELVLIGLPVHDTELDTQGSPLVNRVDQGVLDLFTNLGGNPVPTQTKEAARLKQQLDSKLQSVADNLPKQNHLYGRILMHLVDDYFDRASATAARIHFASDEAVKKIKDRSQESLKAALEPGKPEGAGDEIPEMPFGEAFRIKFRALDGEPADLFVSDLIAAFGDDRTKAKGVSFENGWNAALKTQSERFKSQYDHIFGQAGGIDPQTQRPSGDDPQKLAIARLLLGLAPFLAEEDVANNPEEAKLLVGSPDREPYQSGLLATPSYRRYFNRAQVICGLRMIMTSMAERTGAIRRMSEYVVAAAATDLQGFLLDHDILLQQVREQAAIAKAEAALIDENKEKLAAQEGIAKLRIAELTQVRGDYKKRQDETAAERTRLNGLSRQVLDLRLQIRDAITANAENEKQIRELEKRVRDLQRDAGDK
jgi:hypothetical protein